MLNSDCPLLTGQGYVAEVTVPYPLPANKTCATFQSNPSLGGGRSNELRFEDTKSSDDTFFQTPKDYNIVLTNVSAIVHYGHRETAQTATAPSRSHPARTRRRPRATPRSGSPLAPVR